MSFQESLGLTSVRIFKLRLSVCFIEIGGDMP
jgi:hypothetical protein